MKKLALLTLGLGMALSLSGCFGGGDGDGDSAVVIPNPGPPVKLEDKFGAGFGAAFRASANTPPVAVKPLDVIPVDPTKPPEALR